MLSAIAMRRSERVVRAVNASESKGKRVMAKKWQKYTCTEQRHVQTVSNRCLVRDCVKGSRDDAIRELTRLAFKSQSTRDALFGAVVVARGGRVQLELKFASKLV